MPQDYRHPKMMSIVLNKVILAKGVALDIPVVAATITALSAVVVAVGNEKPTASRKR